MSDSPGAQQEIMSKQPSPSISGTAHAHFAEGSHFSVEGDIGMAGSTKKKQGLFIIYIHKADDTIPIPLGGCHVALCIIAA